MHKCKNLINVQMTIIKNIYTSILFAKIKNIQVIFTLEFFAHTMHKNIVLDFELLMFDMMYCFSYP